MKSFQLPLAALILLTIGSDAAADPRNSQHISFNRDHHQPEPGHHNVGTNSYTHLFPLLRRLRDSTIELFFGRHPTKGVEQPSSSSTSRLQYTNELVLRFNVSTIEEEAALADASTRLFLDIWAFTDNFVDIRLHKDEVIPLLGTLPASLQTAHTALISDLSTAVYRSTHHGKQQELLGPDRVLLDFSPNAAVGDNLFFQDFQPYAVVTRWMRLLEAMFPTHVEYMSIGTSYEGREIPGLRVGIRKPTSSPHIRRTIVISGGLHAREWISTSTVNYVAWSFVTSLGKEPLITKLLEEFDFIFLPLLNPDGIEYTWQVDRLWRKSRQQTSFRFCRGMDLDHAFGFGWDSMATADDPCSESYGGEKPFQAVEASELAAWAKREESVNNVTFVGLLDLHSYSQQVLFPYSFSCWEEPPNLEKLEELAAGMAKAMRLSKGEAYSVTSACEGVVASRGKTSGLPISRIEAGGGSAIDWFYHEMKAHFSYQIKLRDTGSYGFLLPKEHIIPTGEEVVDALKYFGDYVLGNDGIERGYDSRDQDSRSHGNPTDRKQRWEIQELRKRNDHD